MYRTIDCDTWDDPWFAELSPNGKLVFLYFVTNRRTLACGCIEITLRSMEFDIGLSRDALTEAIRELEGRVTWWPELHMIFVRNFLRHQGGNSNRANFIKAAIKSLADLPEIVKASVRDVYPELNDAGVSHTEPIHIPSPSHGYKETEQNRAETETEGFARKTRDANGSNASRKESENEAHRLVRALSERTGVPVTSWPKSTKQANQLLAAKCDQSELMAMVDWFEADPFFAEKGFDLGMAVNQLERFRQSKRTRAATVSRRGVPA